MTNDIARILAQEERLQFERFDQQMAWTIGSEIRALAESRRQAVAIDIEINGLPMFFSAMPGTGLDNIDWIRRKKNVASRFRRSSFGYALWLRAQNITLMERQGLPVRDYAVAGGCFPIVIRGTGMIGTIAVSGLPERIDHELVVEAIATYLGIAYADVALETPADIVPA
ncbi:MAG: heme-degrading domain-containing protein [Gemmatimonadota bacterium]